MDFKTKKMKHTIKLIIIFSIVFTSNLNAQVNLEFNQVVNMFYPYAGSGSTSYDLVVPEGKVLKITSATVYPEFTSTNNNNKSVTFAVDGHTLAQFFSAYYVSNTTSTQDRPILVTNNPFPFWLNAGTHEVIITQSGSIWNSDGSRGASFSGIEFNLAEE
jgi:hypothetical protein